MDQLAFKIIAPAVVGHEHLTHLAAPFRHDARTAMPTCVQKVRTLPPDHAMINGTPK